MSKVNSKVNFTASRLDVFECPEEKEQAFLWDSKVPGLGLRVTKGGARAFVFQSEFQGATVRMTIGAHSVHSIPEAQRKAREFQRQLDEGRDPRILKAEAAAADVARRRSEAAGAVTVGDAWAVYMAEGKPRKKDAWKPRYRTDLAKAASPGGEPKKRGKGKTKPGHLAALMPLRLASVDQDAIRDWYGECARLAPVQAARSAAMFSGFLSWCQTRKEFRGIANTTAARGSELSDLRPLSRPRTDALEVDQLAVWFGGVSKLRNRVAAVYLQALVLTGARREEMAGLKWADIDFQWKKLTLADKVESHRIVPLTPYLSTLLCSLPRTKNEQGEANPFVFASVGSKSGHISEPRSPHADVLADAGIPHVSIHGLRRTFALMGEAAGAPAGAIAQVMGHKPSALAERYKPRPIDALRGYMTVVERFILDKAGVPFVAEQPPTILQLVA